jgi:uncharacterized protein
MVERYLKKTIQQDALESYKMAFISGPRQVGKTFLAKQCLLNNNNYFNWDETSFKKVWIKDPVKTLESIDAGPVVFDELHKYRRWKNSLKGLYDRVGDDVPIIVTGSARLDIFQKGGDSLQGRYLPYRLFPFTVSESGKKNVQPDKLSPQKSNYPLEALMLLGGFPEPLLGGSENKAKRWSRLAVERLVREDIRDFKNIRELELIQLMIELLPDRVGSPLSINSLKEDLQVAYATVREWMMVLKNLYIAFQIKPYSKNIARSLTKESKYYLYNWIPIKNKGALIENIIAVHLLKTCCFWTDAAYGDFKLYYLRTREGLEVDFFITRDDQPWMLVESKSGHTALSPVLQKYAQQFPDAQAFQLTSKQVDRKIPGSNIRLMNTEKFLSMFI